jgi:predicted deacylase
MGALDVNCQLQGIPAFMAEMGSGGKFEEENIAVAERGIKNVMKYLEMIPGEMDSPKEQILITKRRFLYCHKGGFLIPDVKPGDIMSKGQRVAHTIDLFSEVEVSVAPEKVAPEKSFVIMIRNNPIVHTGDKVGLVGIEWEKA